MSDYIPTPTMSEILKEEFMEPMNLSAYRLAKEIHVPVSRIQDILHDRRKISVDTSIRLGIYFGISERYFINLQNDIDMSNNQIIVLEDQMTETIKEIAEINQKMYDKQIEIETIKAKEIDTLSYIERAENELEKSTKRYNKLKSLLENRLVAMYEMGNVSYFDLLLNSRGITEFLSNYYLISEVTSADQDLLQEVEAEKKYNTVLTQTLDEKKVNLQQAREEVEKNEILLGNMNIIKNNRISQLSERTSSSDRKGDKSISS